MNSRYFLSGKQTREFKKNTVQNLECARNGAAFNRAEDEEALPQLAHTSEHTPPGFALFSFDIWTAEELSMAFLGREKKSHS